MRPLVLVALVVAPLLLSSCSSQGDALAEQFRDGTGSNYISGDGAVTVLAPESRATPVSFVGPTDMGDTFSSTDFAGQVMVVNFWYAGCPPCRLEARDLEALNQEFSADGVVFVGVNIFDQAPTALTFAEEFGVTYPSLLDVNKGAVRLAFAGQISPNAVPTTLVMDKQARVAGRISGLLTDPSVLASMITGVLEEDS
jgi:thiol-disulfide isomerase/thioredoxin